MQQQLNIKLGEDDMKVLDRLRKNVKPALTRTAMARGILRGALDNLKAQITPQRGRRGARD